MASTKIENSLTIIIEQCEQFGLNLEIQAQLVMFFLRPGNRYLFDAELISAETTKTLFDIVDSQRPQSVEELKLAQLERLLLRNVLLEFRDSSIDTSAICDATLWELGSTYPLADVEGLETEDFAKFQARREEILDWSKAVKSEINRLAKEKNLAEIITSLIEIKKQVEQHQQAGANLREKNKQVVELYEKRKFIDYKNKRKQLSLEVDKTQYDFNAGDAAEREREKFIEAIDAIIAAIKEFSLYQPDGEATPPVSTDQ